MRIVAGKPLINQRAEPFRSAGGVWSLRELRGVASSVARAAFVIGDNPEDKCTLVRVDHMIPIPAD